MSIDDSRREFLQNAGLGIGWLAALDLFQRHGAAAADGPNPLAPKTPPLPATAKSVISLFMQGGPSQVDTYDPKPLLAKLHGQHPPESFGNEDFQNGKFRDTVILGSKRTFKKYGQSGIEVSDLFPHTSQCVDDLAIIRSCYHEGFTHSQAQFLINNGWPRIGRPSLGSWILYGLGSENQNLPGLRGAAGRRRPLGPGGVRPGLPAGRVPGHVLPPGPQSDSQPDAARRAWSRTQQRDLLATLQD